MSITRSMILMVVVLCIGQTWQEPGASALTLKPSLAITSGVAAFPRLIVAPGDSAADRINQALDRADERVRKAAKECRAEGGEEHSDWTRTITVTMRGPRFLSLLATDSWFCGGAHPNDDEFPLVYDLTTGAPVNWSRLLPASLAGKTATDKAGDDTVVGTLSSPQLHELYIKGFGSDLGDCAEALADPNLSFTIWPSAQTESITIRPWGLIHAVAACGSDGTIPISELRKLNVRSNLPDTIEEAHKQGLYDSK